MTNKEKQFETGWKEYQDKKKQAIEEIHNFILETYDYNSWNKARAFYSAGYQKVNKDSVVLSREEYIELIKIKENCLELMKQGEQQIVNISKETAEEILKAFIDAFPKEKGISSSHAKIHRHIEEIAAQFGIEIKE